MDNNERMALLHEGIIFAETIGSAKCQMDTEDARFLYDLAHRADLIPQWRPIKTAPKDGTLVDIWGVNHLSYDKHSHRMVNVKFGPVRDWMGQERDDWQHGRGEDFEPTHWMPLPAPPKGVE